MPPMSALNHKGRTTPYLIDSLYVEAMLLADEARSYFDGPGRLDRERLSPMGRVTFSCEALRVTTRLMHIINWLLTYKAIDSGELELMPDRYKSPRLAEAAGSEAYMMAMMPVEARSLIDASTSLYKRIDRIDRGLQAARNRDNPVLMFQKRLERVF